VTLECKTVKAKCLFATF